MKMSRQFPLNSLRVFEAAARHLNFTRAGDELGMTQTAVSYQIKLLEENIGEALFVRRPRQITMTETGERLLPKVAEAFGLLGDAMQSARHSADDVLEVHSTPTFASHWLSRHLGNFQLGYPHIAVRLIRHMEKNEPDRGPMDVAIRIGSSPWEGLICHPILRLDYTPMLSPQLAESVGGIHEPGDILKLPWISDFQSGWKDWFQVAGLDAQNVRQHSLNTLGALDLEGNAAIAGHGVALLSPFLFESELASGRLVQPFDLCVGDGKTYWLVYPPNRRNAPKVRAFRQWLMETLPPFEAN